MGGRCRAADLDDRLHDGDRAGVGNGTRVNRRSQFALATTDNDDSAIAAAAMIGLRVIPNAGYSTPAAIRMPRVLYRKANTRFCLMLRIVALDRSTAVTTPDSSPEIKVMSEDSIATSVPVPIAEPTSAWASAGRR